MSYPAPGWRESAGCIGADPDLFFPVTPADETAAKAICGWCPVRPDCLEYATEHFLLGVWGGTTEDDRARERRLMLRRAREKRARAQQRTAA